MQEAHHWVLDPGTSKKQELELILGLWSLMIFGCRGWKPKRNNWKAITQWRGFFLISWFFFDLKMFIKLPSSQSSMALPKWKVEKMMFLLDSVVGWCECIPKKESFRVKGAGRFGWRNVSARNIKMVSSSTWPYTVDSMVWYDANHRNGSIFHLKTKKRWKPYFFCPLEKEIRNL